MSYVALKTPRHQNLMKLFRAVGTLWNSEKPSGHLGFRFGCLALDRTACTGQTEKKIMNTANISVSGFRFSSYGLYTSRKPRTISKRCCAEPLLFHSLWGAEAPGEVTETCGCCWTSSSVLLWALAFPILNFLLVAGDFYIWNFMRESRSSVNIHFRTRHL